MHDQVIGPFFFQEQTINMNTYLDMLELYAVPQIEHLQPHIILQQDGAPPHWGLQVRAYLDRTFPGRWNVLLSPDGKSHNQIDHVLVLRRRRSRTPDV
jgi:hypothetical protein